jgi:hypothetical protein
LGAPDVPAARRSPTCATSQTVRHAPRPYNLAIQRGAAALAAGLVVLLAAGLRLAALDLAPLKLDEVDALSRARALVEQGVVPLTGGQTHAGPSHGWQVTLRRDDGDVLVGKAVVDWRRARDLAEQLCQATELPLDELTQRLFSQVGQYSPRQ